MVDLKTQLGYFKNVGQLLRQKLGDTEATDLLPKAVYLFSVGGNDYAFAFETNSSVVRSSSPEQLVGKYTFQTMWPLACTPYIRAFSSGNVCLDQITPYLQLHNEELSNLLQKLQRELKDSNFNFWNFIHSLKKE